MNRYGGKWDGVLVVMVMLLAPVAAAVLRNALLMLGISPVWGAVVTMAVCLVWGVAVELRERR